MWLLLLHFNVTEIEIWSRLFLSSFGQDTGKKLDSTAILHPHISMKSFLATPVTGYVPSPQVSYAILEQPLSLFKKLELKS